MMIVLFRAVWTKISFKFLFRRYAIIVLKGVSEGTVDCMERKCCLMDLLKEPR